MLQSILKESGVDDLQVIHVSDRYAETLESVSHLLDTVDLLLCSGGISVGDYDFVGKALHEAGVESLFYKVNQKPGKPLFFGRRKNTLVFGLPGNPAAALTCFYVYVKNALQKMEASTLKSEKKVARMKERFQRKGTRAQFLKASLKNGTVTILEAQSSAMLSSFSYSNVLAFVPDSTEVVAEGEEVEVIELK